MVRILTKNAVILSKFIQMCSPARLKITHLKYIEKQQGKRICWSLSRTWSLFNRHYGTQNIKPVLIKDKKCSAVSMVNDNVNIQDLKMDKSLYIQPNDTGVCLLECRAAFEGLSDKERLYAHYLSRASFYGSLICYVQTSPESPGLFVLLQKLFRAQSAEELGLAAVAKGLSEEEYKAFCVYAASVYANSGNYKSFGDSKIIPGLPKEKLEAIILASSAYQSDKEGILSLWNSLSDVMYSITQKNQQLGLGSNGITTYFSGNCDQSDAELAQEFLSSKSLDAYNTRLFKRQTNAGDTEYEVCLASAATTDDSVPGFNDNHPLGSYKFKDVTFVVSRGDYSPLMQLCVDNLVKAKEYAANKNERKMLECYVDSFTTGSLRAHKDGSRYWIRDVQPIIECYIGFIETYRDPFGQRGEFEGFVAMVNKEMSEKFGSLVSNAESFLPLLPWPSCYEKNKFLRPDFTSLDVLSYGSSGIPAGINIPNYDDIRQDEGFKNVSLGNVLSSGYKDVKVTFLGSEDTELYIKYKAPSFEVQVGLHELLGHGSGKLFKRESDGQFNFDTEHVKHTETGEKISSWYEPGETWDSKFTVIASTYEECRAECVGLYLCLSADILRIFGHEGDVADDIIYVNWLNMVRAGLLALEFYSPQSQTWRQAHMQARYVILQVLLEAGEGLVTVSHVKGEDDMPDLIISLDRSKINSVGKPAIGNFLKKLQVYKSTADWDAGKLMYDNYSAVDDVREPKFLSLRDTVMARKQPRKMFVQCNTVVKGDSVELKEYEATPAGLIQSNVERFSSPTTDQILRQLWEKDQGHFV